jgi:hypothetical protein
LTVLGKVPLSSGVKVAVQAAQVAADAARIAAEKASMLQRL